MKKLCLMVALIATVAVAGVKAQTQEYKYVSPLNVEMIQFDLQALRDSAINDEAYKIALTTLQKQLEKEKSDINDAQNSLKQERKLYDAQMSLYKTRTKQVKNMKKVMQNAVKEYNSNIKDIKKQYDIIGKIDDTHCAAISNQTKYVDSILKENEREKDHCEQIQDDIEKHAEGSLNETFTMLNQFLIEITDKDTKIKNFAAQNKTNIEIVKAAIKSLKK